MFLSIAGPKTIHEYNNLKHSKQEIKINTTSKQMDEYVYDKNGGLRNIGIISGFALLDTLILDMLKNDKAIKESPKFIKYLIGGITLMLNIYAGKVIYDTEKNKKAVLNNPQEKLKTYQKSGLNAVI